MRVCQDLPEFQKMWSWSDPSFRLIGSQILRSQLFKVCRQRQSCVTTIINSVTSRPGDVEVSPEQHCKKWGTRWAYTLLSGRNYWVVAMPGKNTRWCPLAYVPGEHHAASRSVAYLKPAPQAEVPRQTNRPFSQENWSCASVCYLCSALGVLVGPKLPLQLLQSHGTQEHKDHPSQTIKESPLCGLCAHTGLNKAVGECKSWVWPLALERQLEVWGQGVPSAFTRTLGNCRNHVSLCAVAR